MLDLEADRFKSLSCLGQGTHFWDATAQLDLMCQGLVFWNGGIPCIRHTPFINTKLDPQVSRAVPLRAKGLNILRLQV
jgi:hypothetical protein